MGDQRLTVETLVAGASQARIAFRLGDAAGEGLSGSVTGPHCRFTRTLPANYPIAGGTAQIPDPCYWSPALPHRYEAVVTARVAGEDAVAFRQPFALRRLALAQRQYVLDGRGFVVRGWRGPAAQPIDEIDWAALRESQLAVWVDSAREVADLARLLAAAESWGVWVAGDVPGDLYACALAAPAAARLRCPIDADQVDRHGGPHFAVRFVTDVPDAAAARRACERLQADCAPHTDLAGYVV
ncbi:MAG: hypothetical protein AAF805_01970 [Planctomycetota bacterium]